MKSKRTTIATNGMDVIVLRRDMTFDEQMTLNNAIYVIKYVFDLNNETTILPDNCVLKFIGGKLQNGIIGLNNAKIEACGEIFGEGLSFIGKIQNEASPEWFEVVDEQNSNDSSSDSIKIERAINAFSSIKLASRDYVIDRPINIRKSCFIKGDSFACFFSAEESDSSRTRLIATNHIPCILNINMDYDNNIPNEKNTDESRVQDSVDNHFSVVIDSVCFSADRCSNVRCSNGVNFVDSGPSRPFIIKNCRFRWLKYGLFFTNISRGTENDMMRDSIISTCVSVLNIKNNSFYGNHWGIVATGRHAIMTSVIENNVIESNIQGGIFIDDHLPEEEINNSDNSFRDSAAVSAPHHPIYGGMLIHYNLLEGQPVPLHLKAHLADVTIKCNYFESQRNQNIVLKGEAGSNAPIFRLVSNTSVTGSEMLTFDIDFSTVILEGLQSSNNIFNLRNCIVKGDFVQRLNYCVNSIFMQGINRFANFMNNGYQYYQFSSDNDPLIDNVVDFPNFMVDHDKPYFRSISNNVEGETFLLKGQNEILSNSPYVLVLPVYANESSLSQLKLSVGGVSLVNQLIPLNNTGNITFLNSKFVVGNVPSSSNKFVLNLKKGNGNLIVGHPFVIYLGNQNNTIDYNVFGYDINSQLPPSFITNITNNISGDMFFDKRLNTIVFYDGSNWRKLKAEAIEQI